MSDFLDYHPVANLFPMMDDESFADLCADIEANGLYEPIWRHGGAIIDGRNRYKACRKIKVEPQFREWNGRGSLVSFVLSLNLKRRHLTTGQKAAVGFHMLPLLEAEAKERQGTRSDIVEILPQSEQGKSRDQAAAMVGVSGKYVSDAKAIAEQSPEIFKKVESGELSIPEAKREVAEKKGVQPTERPAHTGSGASQYASSAMNQLSRIDDDDSNAILELEKVRDYINRRIENISKQGHMK